ncbi:MAG TPA: hypothetical protein V6D27_04500 [Vampirovibrionales bacterium]
MTGAVCQPSEVLRSLKSQVQSNLDETSISPTGLSGGNFAV